MKSSYEKYYDERAKGYDPEGFGDDRFSNVKEFVKSTGTNRRILDIGCGNGWISTLYRQEGDEIYGIELVDLSIQRSRKRGIKVIKGNLEEPLPLKDRSLDIIVASEVLEHLFFPENLLREANRVLKDYGTFVLTVPNIHNLKNRIDILLGRNVRFIEYPPNMEHIRHYSKKGMIQLLKKAGFRVLEVRGNSWHMSSKLLFRILWFMHGGNRGLKLILKFLSFGKSNEDNPALILRHHFSRILGKLLPTFSGGLIFRAVKIRPVR
ncbi:MAG TPA: class I SAM-dependent methyltransferase [Candidatus Scalindua sp.]|nr:class I SAM-dependent methyltransferase [Candidatus Scalindua sp.]